MLRLGRSVLTQLINSSSSVPVSQLHRLLSAAAPRISPNPSFAVEDYLVGTCGLTRAQALKASANLSHVKSPTNPDSILAFLAGLDFSSADVAALVAKDPKFLCTRVEKTLAPTVVALTELGFSHTEIARLVSLVPASFRCRSIFSKLPYYMSLLGSYENLARFLQQNSGLLGCSLEKVVKPNVAYLRECGLSSSDIAKLCRPVPSILSAKLENVQATVVCAERLGVPRGSGMFMQMLQAVAFLSEEKIAIQVEYLKKVFRWSDAEVGVAVCKAPRLLKTTKDTMQNKSEFLFSEVQLEPAYIANRAVMLMYSLEGRIRPRYYVLKFLKEKALLHQDRDYYSALMIAKKLFMEKFICPHKESAPQLAEDYAAACRGEVPTRFKFT